MQRRIQKLQMQHVRRLSIICSMQDKHVLELENCSTSLAGKSELLTLRKNCLAARKSVDKPNVHSLIELVYTTLPMVSHLSVVGELSLETAHQS